MKPWQWLLLSLIAITGLLIPIPEDAPKGQEQGNTGLRGTVVPEVMPWVRRIEIEP